MDRRIFTLADQLAFATLSGDFNPMHVDPVRARRTMFGVPVVHGAHLVLWALERMLPDDAGRITRLRVSFDHAVRIGDEAELRAKASSPDGREIIIASNGRQACRIRIDLGSEATGMPAPERDGSASNEPQEWTLERIGGASGRFALEVARDTATALVPRTFARAPQIVSLLAALSRLVGMECPGLHSILSSFDAHRRDAPQPDNDMHWSVTEFDERFSKAAIDASCDTFEIKVAAFLRPPPQRQPTADELRGQVPSGIFAGRRAVIVGGSRGLGELCAKLLAVGGADVRITFNSGAADAEAVAEDIRGAGGVAHTIRYDVLGDASPDLSEMVAGWQPTHLYYFASPPIFVATRRFSVDLFSRFCDFYVGGFVNAVRAFRSGPLHAFYPSSVAIDDLVPDMGEYAAAKAAGETAGRQMEKVDRDLVIQIVRLPRLPTDQTSTVFPTETADPVPILLAILTNDPNGGPILAAPGHEV